MVATLQETRPTAPESQSWPHTVPPTIDLPSETRAAMVALLNRLLADGLDLSSQVKQAHWNVKGPQFMPLHLLFDEIAERLADAADEIAERAVTLGGFAAGTVRITAAASRLTELPGDLAAGIGYVAALVERFAQVATSTRSGIDAAAASNDADTADLLTEVSRQLDKDLWFLQAHLEA